MFERIGHPHTCHGSCRNRTPQRAIPGFAGADTQDLVELGDEYRDVLSESDIPTPAPVAAGTDPYSALFPVSPVRIRGIWLSPVTNIVTF